MDEQDTRFEIQYEAVSGIWVNYYSPDNEAEAVEKLKALRFQTPTLKIRCVKVTTTREVCPWSVETPEKAETT